MKNLQKGISLFEIVLGLILGGVAVWSYLNIFRCPEDSWDCEGWALLGVYMVVPVSFFTLLSGVVQIKTKSWYSQLLLLPSLGWVLYWMVI